MADMEMTSDQPSLPLGETPTGRTRAQRNWFWKKANFLILVASCIIIYRATELGVDIDIALRDDHYLVPAWQASRIWRLIFVVEGIFVLWHCLQRERDNTPKRKLDMLVQASPWWCAALLFQIGWSFTFTSPLENRGFLWISAACISCAFVCLAVAHGIIFENKRDFSDFLYMDVPISIHFGWVTCLVFINWSMYAAGALANVIMLIIFLSIMSVVALTVVAGRRSFFYGLAVAWTYFWIAAKTDVSEGMRKDLGDFSIRLIVCIEMGVAVALIAFPLVVSFFRPREIPKEDLTDLVMA